MEVILICIDLKLVGVYKRRNKFHINLILKKAQEINNVL